MLEGQIYIATMEFHRNIHGNDFKKRTFVKAFSTLEKAEEFLVMVGFVYGTPYPFRVAGWYHQESGVRSNGDLRDIVEYVEARIEPVEIDSGTEKGRYEFYNAFINGEALC